MASKILIRSLAQSLTRSPGQGLAEYAVMLLLVAIVTVGALTALGTNISSEIGRSAAAFP